MPARKIAKFAIEPKVNPARMGSLKSHFLEIEGAFKKSPMGQRLLEAATKKENTFEKNPHEKAAQLEYLGSLMDYYNRLSYFARKQGANEVYHYLQLQASGLEREFGRVSKEART
ncbi:MAG: hypothetical protein NUV67_02525 [archaeon]|nr:hypothetical protein [archaeon]